MNQVEAIAAKIRSLPPQDFSSLQEWFHGFEDRLWDEQIAEDFRAGKFNKLIERARHEFAQGKAKPL